MLLPLFNVVKSADIIKSLTCRQESAESQSPNVILNSPEISLVTPSTICRAPRCRAGHPPAERGRGRPTGSAPASRRWRRGWPGCRARHRLRSRGPCTAGYRAPAAGSAAGCPSPGRSAPALHRGGLCRSHPLHGGRWARRCRRRSPPPAAPDLCSYRAGL